MKTCFIVGCPNKHDARGYCHKHYYHLMRYGDASHQHRLTNPLNKGQCCSIANCSRSAHSRGWCQAHYRRWSKTGDPTGVKERSNKRGICSVQDCGKVHSARGYCASHYSRWKSNTSQDATELRILKKDNGCTIVNCTGKYQARGLCGAHYSRLRNYGDPLSEIPLGNIRQAKKKLNGKVKPRCRTKSVEPLLGEYRGYVRKTIYLPDGTSIRDFEHRLVMEEILGRSLYRFENVHHINGIRNDNRPGNLELWTKPSTAGQRVQDLVAWVIDNYMPEIKAELKKRRTK